jgi:hypothetical protein
MTEQRGDKTFEELRKRAKKLGWDLKYSVMVSRPHINEYVLEGQWNGVLRMARYNRLKDVKGQLVYMERAIKKGPYNPITMKAIPYETHTMREKRT